MKAKNWLAKVRTLAGFTFFLLVSFSIQAQNTANVSGTIRDSLGIGIPNVSINVKGRTTGAISAQDGSYSIRAERGATLVFSSIGYQTQEETVSGDRLDVVMNAEAQSAGDEIVVVGYGTQRRVNLTGSVASINTEELVNKPVTSVQNALQGVSPGLTVLSRPGSVTKGNANATVTVRGRTNLGTPGPMIIIDGIPASNTELTALNPNDIASMSILKDAASAAIYGSRAANGVMLITTKQGIGVDRLSIGINMNYGIQSATRMPTYVGAVDYMKLFNEARINAGATQPTYSDSLINLFVTNANPDLYPNTNWFDLIFKKTAPQSQYSIDITSSGKYTTYFLGVSYFNQQSLLPKQYQNRYTVRLNTQTKVIPELLKIGTNVSFTKQDFNNDGGNNVSISEMGRSLPISTARQSDGSWGSITAGKENAQIAGRNQLRLLEEGGSSYNKDNYLQLAGNATLTPLKGFSLNGLYSIKYTNENSWSFSKTLSPIIGWISKLPMDATARKVNNMREYWGKRQEMLAQVYADYQVNIYKHYFKVMTGVSQESNEYRVAYLGRKNFPTNDPTNLNTGSTAADDAYADADGQPNRTTTSEWAMRSVFGRLNYNFDERYLLEANLRADYSSRFIKELRGHIFPSFSAAWLVSKENFMNNVNWINLLKLRGSWGKLGNQDVVPVGNYSSLINFGYQYSFDGVAYDGAYQSNGVNRLATWETVTMTDIGIDAAFLKNRLNLTVDYYEKKTEGILRRLAALATYGVTVPFSNAASTQNKGIELALNYKGNIGNDFNYSIGGNLSIIKNKILSLGGENENISSPWIERVGESVGAFYGYIADGLFATDEEAKNHAFQSNTTRAGDIKYRDLNGDKKIDAADRAIIGNDVPWNNYGFTLDMSYKNFDLNILTYGVTDVQTKLTEEASWAFFNGAGVKTQYLDHRWTKENPDPNAYFPRLLEDGKLNNSFSSFWLFNAAYFRVRSIILGYNLPQNILEKMQLKNARFYISANNPFTFMADKRLGDFDPEVASGRGSYPGIKTWSIGINVRL